MWLLREETINNDLYIKQANPRNSQINLIKLSKIISRDEAENFINLSLNRSCQFLQITLIIREVETQID